jgi:hypothetical protein
MARSFFTLLALQFAIKATKLQTARREISMTAAEIISALGSAVSAASMGLAALIWAIRRRR